MAKNPKPPQGSNDGATNANSSIDQLMLAAQERGDETFETGRYMITYKENAIDDGLQSLKAQGLRIADARDFADQALALEDVGDAEAVVFPEVGVALMAGKPFEERGLSPQSEIPQDSPIEAIEPEYFVFADDVPNNQYLRGFMRAVETIANDLARAEFPMDETEVEPEVVGATWGLVRCKVVPSLRSGAGIKVAVARHRHGSRASGFFRTHLHRQELRRPAGTGSA
jgi:subtilisin